MGRRLRRREAQATGRERFAERPAHRGDVVVGGGLVAAVAHRDPPQRRVADEEPGVHRERAVEAVEVLPERLPVPGHAGGEGLEGHALDAGEHAHEVVGFARGQRRDREAAVAADDRRDAVQR